MPISLNIDARKNLARDIKRCSSEPSVDDISTPTRQYFIRIAQTLFSRSGDTQVLAGTEIPLVIRQQDVDFPIIDTVKVHCEAIVSQLFQPTTIESRREPCVALI